MEDWKELNTKHFTSFLLSTLDSDDPTPPMVEMEIAGIKVDKNYCVKPMPHSFRSIDPVREFKKGIKRDQNLFPMLTHEST